MELPHTRRSGFTLIELLVVIAIIAVIAGILLPALAKARETAKNGQCASNCHQMGVIMNSYSNVSKDWYPVLPIPTAYRSSTVLNGQFAHGGVAALFSLCQLGDATAPGTANGDAGFCGVTGNPDTAAYSNGSREPLLAQFIDGGFGILNCPSDVEDRYYGPVTQPGQGQLATATRKTPRQPRNQDDVISYTISYLYVAGLRSDEPVLVQPVPIWGDETNGPDVSTDAWYGAGGGNSGNATSAQSRPGYYGPFDNHGEAGGNFAFTDGHHEFLAGNVHETFFSPENTQGQSVNVIDPNRSRKTQTID